MYEIKVSHSPEFLKSVLNKFNKRAQRLYFTGAWPQASFGIEAYGVTTRQRSHLRALAAQAAGMTQGGCPIALSTTKPGTGSGEN